MQAALLLTQTPDKDEAQGDSRKHHGKVRKRLRQPGRETDHTVAAKRPKYGQNNQRQRRL